MRALTQDEFIERSRSVHGERFAYERLLYVNARTPVILTCREHGEFTADAATHLRGVNSCSRCNGQEPMNFQRAQAMIEKLFSGNIALIPGQSISSMRSPATATCLLHGVNFTTVIRSLLQGQNGCSLCQPSGKKLSLEVFLARAERMYGGKYSYEAIRVLPGIHGSIEVTCREHEYTFSQSVDNHLSGREGCLPCRASTRSSRGEEELTRFIEGLGYGVKRGDRSVLRGREIDVLIPALSLGFEYNGEYWHSDAVVRRNTGMGADEYHSMKLSMAAKAGVKLHFIWEREWRGEREATESRVRKILLTGERG